MQDIQIPGLFPSSASSASFISDKHRVHSYEFVATYLSRGGMERSRLKFVAVCVARRLITLPAHVSLSGSICPHDIKPFATREFRNWLICLVSFSFFYVTISDNSITPNANNRISLFINHSILSIHH